jgi:hypothetical protein
VLPVLLPLREKDGRVEGCKYFPSELGVCDMY